MRIERTPMSWHVEYRLEEEGGHVSTDKVWVRRPFDSVLETWEGAPPGSGSSAVVRQLATFGRRTIGETTLELLTGVPASDVRLGPVLEAALDARVLVRRDVRKEIAGRRCEVYRSRQLLSAPSLQAPTAKEYGDSCVDAAGLVLEEVLVDDGDVLARRVAVTVEEDPPSGVGGDERFPVLAQKLTVKEGGGSVRPLVTGNRPPGEFFELDGPAGSAVAPVSAGGERFEYRGRWSVVPPQPENFDDSDLQAPLRRRAGVVDVWVRGADIVMIDQGGTHGGAEPYTPDPSAPTIDMGPTLGKGEVVLSAQGVAVRVLVPGGRYVRVTGTRPPAELAALARRLTVQPGGTLDFADD